jgi:redox-sensitive bicupin YhaK (pirin superfamily)
MKSSLHKAESRGHANHGWLESYHSFSFASYYNPERMSFGVLRVLNDDRIAAGTGFGTHPHENMEIISIPLSGSLKHKDSMGNETLIKAGEIQVMSAGKGVQHSEMNGSSYEEARFLQIWIIPNERNVVPRYDQILIPTNTSNELVQVVSPNKNENGVWIHQNAWFHIGHFNEETTIDYHLRHPGNGVYIFVLEGAVLAAGNQLLRRDGLGLWDVDMVTIECSTSTHVLVMEVPLV